MEENEKLVKEIGEKITTLKSEMASKASAEEVENLKTQLKQYESVEAMLTKQGEEIAILKKSHQNQHAGFVDAIGETIQKNAEQIKALKANGGKLVMDVKAVGNMTTSNISGRQMLGAELIPGFTPIARRRPFMMEIVSVRPNSSGKVNWVDKRAGEGGAGGTAEGASKNQVDFDLVEVSTNLKKRTVFIKVSEEMLEDIDYIQSEIKNELLELLKLDLDNQILFGDGIGTNLNGIDTIAVAWSAGSQAGNVDNANNWDVLKVGITQMINNHFYPTVILMNPSDHCGMLLEKGTDGHYVTPTFATPDGKEIAGIPVVQNPNVTEGDFYIIDGTKCATHLKKGLRLEMDRDGEDFTKNMWTILAEVRAENIISQNNYNAFIVGTFADAIADLETP